MREGDNREVQMSNIKCQLKSQYLMSNNTQLSLSLVSALLSGE